MERELPVPARPVQMAAALHLRGVTRLPARGVDDVTVVCPGFAVDCLETLEEIAMENRQRFLQVGRPQVLRMCPR